MQCNIRNMVKAILELMRTDYSFMSLPCESELNRHLPPNTFIFYYLKNKLKKTNCLRWAFYNWNLIEPFHCTSRLQICFSNGENISNGCFCNDAVFNSFLINIKSYFNIINANKNCNLISLFLSNIIGSEVNIYSFIGPNVKNNLICEEVSFIEEDDNENIIDFVDEICFEIEFAVKPCVIILFITAKFFFKFINLMNYLAKWFNNHNIIIWGCTIDELSICRCSLKKNYCKINTEFLFIFINKLINEPKYKHLRENCNNEHRIRKELIKFKSNLNLSSNSRALMHISYDRMKKLQDLDAFIFKEVFPDLTLLTIYGRGSVIENSLADFVWGLFITPNPFEGTNIIVLTCR